MFARTAALVALVGTLVVPTPDGDDAADLVPPEKGVFNSACRFSHRAPDDPIVHPGHEGMAHSHDFIGNETTDAHSTYDTMVGRRTTCDRPRDTAAYWFPTLSKDGVPQESRLTLVYYRTGGLADKEQIRPIPADLKIIAGSASATGPQDVRIVSWSCGDDPWYVRFDHIPANCDGEQLVLHFDFPNCWDGERLDSRDHQSHMAYAWEGDDHSGQCPASHPVQLPSVEINTRWMIEGPNTGITLASGAPYTAHADFWNTWVQKRMVHLTKKCIAGSRVCK